MVAIVKAESVASAAAVRAAAAYNSAADHYDEPALGFWGRFGRETVTRMRLRPGDRVLDACCGAGASALAAARSVGESGAVIGVDVAEALLRLAAAKATAAGLRNVQLVCADAGSADQDDGSFDAVVCVFGIFFAADPAAFAATLWRCVRPGGTLAITTWGPDLFEPGNSILWDEIGRVRPDLYKSFNPWDSLVTTDALSALLRAAGAPDPEVEAVPGVQPLADPDGFWDIALGSGYRATIDALDAADAGQVRGHVIRELSKREVTEVTTNVVFGLARKPPA